MDPINKDEILIFRKDEDIRRSEEEGIIEGKLDIEDLSKEVLSFQQKLQLVFNKMDKTKKGFRVTEITINAEVSASGKIGILGLGVQSSIKSGISFKFIRD